MKSKIKNIIDYLLLLFFGRGEKAKEFVEAGLLDFSGQGRNEYGN